MSVISVLFRPPKVLVDFHDAFSSILVHFHPLNVNAKAVDEDPSEVVHEPGFRVTIREFKGQRERVRDYTLARIQCWNADRVDVLWRRLGFDERRDVDASLPFDRR